MNFRVMSDTQLQRVIFWVLGSQLQNCSSTRNPRSCQICSDASFVYA